MPPSGPDGRLATEGSARESRWRFISSRWSSVSEVRRLQLFRVSSNLPARSTGRVVVRVGERERARCDAPARATALGLLLLGPSARHSSCPSFGPSPFQQQVEARRPDNPSGGPSLPRDCERSVRDHVVPHRPDEEVRRLSSVAPGCSSDDCLSDPIWRCPERTPRFLRPLGMAWQEGGMRCRGQRDGERGGEEQPGPPTSKRCPRLPEEQKAGIHAVSRGAVRRAFEGVPPPAMLQVDTGHSLVAMYNKAWSESHARKYEKQVHSICNHVTTCTINFFNGSQCIQRHMG